MKNNKKGFASVVLIGVVVLVLALGGYVWSKKSKESNTSASANWKTYKNDTFGFEFEYPANLTIDEDKSNYRGKPSVNVWVDTVNNIELNKPKTGNPGSDGHPLFFGVNVYQLGPTDGENIECQQKNLISSKITIDSIPVTKCIEEGGLHGTSMDAIFTKDKVIYYHVYVSDYAGNNKNLVDHLLSTFKFTDSKKESSAEAQMRIAVEKVLAQKTLANSGQPMPKGIKLLSVKLNENQVTFDFSKEILSDGQATFENIFSLVSSATHDIIQGTGKDPKYAEVKYTVLVEGKKPEYN